MTLERNRAESVFANFMMEKLWRSTSILEDSVTYQAIIDKGIERGFAIGERIEARRFLLRLGRKRFGPPDEATVTLVESLVTPR
jgi:hypothetical protein